MHSKQRRLAWKLLAILSVIGTLAFLARCATAPNVPVTIDDYEYWIDEGPLGADGNWLFSDDTEHVNAADWNIQRVGYFCIEGSDVGQIKAELESLCSVTPCTEQVHKALNRINSLLNK